MRLIIICGLMFLTACAGVPFSKEMTPHPRPLEQERFVAALDQFSATGKLDLMIEFTQSCPDSSWTVYADAISLCGRDLSASKSQLTELEMKNQQLSSELASLKQENLQLAEKIEQLKKLLIELEQRPQ